MPLLGHLCVLCDVDDMKHHFSSLSAAVKGGHVHTSQGMLESTHQWGCLLFGNHTMEITRAEQCSASWCFPCLQSSHRAQSHIVLLWQFVRDKSFTNHLNDCIHSFDVLNPLVITLFDLCMMENFEFNPPVPNIKHNSFWLNSVSYERLASLDIKASSSRDCMVYLGNEYLE